MMLDLTGRGHLAINANLAVLSNTSKELFTIIHRLHATSHATIALLMAW